jgi:hypothetical protein
MADAPPDETTGRIAPARQRAFTSLLEKRNWHAILGYVNLERRVAPV